MRNHLVVLSYFGISWGISDNYPYRVQAKLIPKGHHGKEIDKNHIQKLEDPLGMSDSE